MEATSRGKRKRNAHANSRMLNIVVAVVVFLLMLALVNVIFLHSHIHSYMNHSDLVSQSVARSASKNSDISMQSLLKTNNATGFLLGDLSTCPGLPRTASLEKSYTIIALCSEDYLPFVVHKVLQWMHDPSVHQIYLLFPSSARKILLHDLYYGFRLLHWEQQQAIQLLFVDSAAKFLQDIHVSTGAVVWVPEPHARVSTKRIREAFEQWKNDASRPISISNVNGSGKQWFLLHRNWLCASQSMTNSTTSAWGVTSLHHLFSLLSSNKPLEFSQNAWR
jgi:hypothetical protein